MQKDSYKWNKRPNYRLEFRYTLLLDLLSLTRFTIFSNILILDSQVDDLKLSKVHLNLIKT